MVILVPTTVWCWLCGTAGGAWPLDSACPVGRTKFVQSIQVAPDLKSHFWLVRTGAKTMAVATAKNSDYVSSIRSAGITAKIKAAFVPTSVWNALNKDVKPASVPGIVEVTIYLPGDQSMGGARC